MISSSPLAALGECVRTRASGTLTVKSDKVVRQFVFSEGGCISAVSNAKSELPGTYLQKQGALTPEQYEAYMAEVRKPKAQLWDAAAKISAMLSDALAKHRKGYASWLAGCLPGASSAVAQFAEGAPAQPGDKVHGLSLLIAACNGATGDALRSMIPDYRDDSSIFFEAAAEKALSPLPLTPEETGLLTVVKNNSQVSDVFSSSFLGKERIEKLLASLILAGLVRLEGAAAATKRKHDTSLTPERKKLAERILAKHRSLSASSYYDWLDLPGNAKAEKIQEASNGWIEQLSSPDLENLFVGDDENIPTRLIESMKEAAKVLMHPAQRVEYDRFLSGGGRGSFLQKSVVGKEEELLGRAQAAKAAGNLPEAFEILVAAAAEVPNSSQIHTELASTALEAFGPSNAPMRDLAMASIKKALALPPVRAEACETLGKWMEAMGQKEKAVESYKRALSLSPHAKVAYESLKRLVPAEANAQSVMGIARNLERLNYYELLGLAEAAPPRELQLAYRECTRRFHPDRFFQGDPAVKDSANTVYKRMVRAYTTLKDANRRKEYDFLLTKNRATAAPAPLTAVAEAPQEEDPTELTPKTQQGKKFFQMAITALQQGKKDTAKLNLKLALQIEPDSAAVKKKIKELG